MSGAASGRSPDSALTRLHEEMDRHLAHERRRLRLIAAILEALAILVAAGHLRADAGAITVIPSNIDDLLAGYPTAVALAVVALAVWRRGRL